MEALFTVSAGRTPWAAIREYSKIVGFALGFIALGAIGQSIYDGSAKLPWLHQQAAELHATRAVIIPRLKALAKCEHTRAQTNEAIAEEAMVGARPLPGDVAADCPHQPAVKE